MNWTELKFWRRVGLVWAWLTCVCVCVVLCLCTGSCVCWPDHSNTSAALFLLVLRYPLNRLGSRPRSLRHVCHSYWSVAITHWSGPFVRIKECPHLHLLSELPSFGLLKGLPFLTKHEYSSKINRNLYLKKGINNKGDFNPLKHFFSFYNMLEKSPRYIVYVQVVWIAHTRRMAYVGNTENDQLCVLWMARILYEQRFRCLISVSIAVYL